MYYVKPISPKGTKNLARSFFLYFKVLKQQFREQNENLSSKNLQYFEKNPCGRNRKILENPNKKS